MSNKLKMTLLIDELSHPHLYAHLLTINGLRNRTERIRYLASMGLVLQPLMSAVTPATAAAPAASMSPGQGAASPTDKPESAPSQTLVPLQVSPVPVDSQSTLPDLSLLSTSASTTSSSDGPEMPAGQGVSDVTVDREPAPVQTPPQEESLAAKAARQMAKAGLFGVPSTTKPGPNR